MESTEVGQVRGHLRIASLLILLSIIFLAAEDNSLSFMLSISGVVVIVAILKCNLGKSEKVCIFFGVAGFLSLEFLR